MRIFDCPNSRSTSRGFTLIEILVVLFIVTILAGLTVSQLPTFSSSADLDTEARRLELLFTMARTEAVMESAEMGFRRTDKGYEFLRYDDGQQRWQRAESPFQGRSLAEGLRMTVRADREGYAQLGENLPPVLILSSGETTPFRIVLDARASGESKTLIASEYGELTWDQDD